MALIVQKFGGSSVADIDRIRNVANRVAEYRHRGDQVVVVVSAMKGVTDNLIDMAKSLMPVPSEREMDMLLATGEQTTIALLAIALLQGIYLIGIGPLRERYRLADSIEPRQIATFTAGVVILFFAFTSPIHVLGENFLFSMHMLQHLLVTLIAPPLLILGTPDWLLRPLLRPNWAFRTARILTNPLVAFGTFNMVFALWPIPALYNSSLTIEGVHAFEHMIMIATAMLVWWPLTSMLP